MYQLETIEPHPKLGERLGGLLQQKGSLYPCFRGDAADAETRATELGFTLDTRDARSELSGSNRCGVPAGPAPEDSDIHVDVLRRHHCSHLSTLRLWLAVLRSAIGTMTVRELEIFLIARAMERSEGDTNVRSSGDRAHNGGQSWIWIMTSGP